VSVTFHTLDECAFLVRDSIHPRDAKGMPYIGLEHIEEGALHLKGHGWAEDVTSAKSEFKKGDILFGKLRPYFRKAVIAPFDGVCSTDIWVVRAKPCMIQDYVFYWMASEDFVNFANSGSIGTRMPRAKWEHASRHKQRKRSADEQRAIARILGTLDDKIETNRKMNTTLESIAQTLFQSWFIDFTPVHAKSKGRNPGLPPQFADLFPSKFENSKLGRIPKGWTVKPLDEIAEFLNGMALQKHPPGPGESGLPVIKIAELRSGITNRSDRASAGIPEKYIIENGDILFSWSASLMQTIWTGGPGALNQHLFKVSSLEYPRWFHYFWVDKHLPDFQAIAAGKATSMGHIQRHHLTEARTIIPDTRLLQAADAHIAPLFAQVVSTAQSIHALTTIRDAMLPKLLSGELRIKA